MADRTGGVHRFLDLPSRTRLVIGLMIALVGPLAVTPIARIEALRPVPALPYMLVVVAATVFGRLLASSVAIACSVALLEYYLIGPQGRFGGNWSADLWAIASFALVAFVVTQLLLRRDRALQHAQEERERLAFLTSVGDTLSRSLDYRATLNELADVLIPEIADWYAVDLLQDGEIVNVAVWHRDPQKVQLAHDLRALIPQPFDAPAGTPKVIRTGEPELTETFSDELLENLGLEPDIVQIVRGLGLRCSMIVPLTARGRTFGSMTLVGAETHERFSPSDLRLAKAIADRAALAIDNARLFAKQAEAHEEAAEEARHNELLRDVTAAFGRAVSTEDVVAAMLERGIGAAGAGQGVVGLLSPDGERVDVVATRGYEPGPASDWRSLPVDGPYPLADAIRRRRPVVLRSTEERDRTYPALVGEGISEDHVLACLPLLLGERAVGGFSASFPPGMELDDARLSLLRSVGEQCAQAVERAAARERESRTRHRFDALATISRGIAATLDHDDTVSAIARHLVEHLGTKASVYLLEHGAIELAASASLDERGRPVVSVHAAERRSEPPTDVRDAIDLGETRLVDKADAEGGAPDGASAIVLPLTISGRVLGAVSVSDAAGGRDFGEPDELAFSHEVARRMARAIENARLYRERDYIARTLQQSLLPPVLPEIPSLDAEALFLPAIRRFGIGGDFYDVFETPTGRWAAMIGDVCGKGVEAAALTALARHTLRASAGVERPSEALWALNDVLLREHLDGKFCTVCFALLDQDALGGMRVTLACGGHPLPQLVTADGERLVVGAHGTLLGVTEDPRFTDIEVRLTPGSTLVMYTDGLLRKEEVFADEPVQLVHALQGDPPRTAAEAKARIQRYVDDLTATEQADDIAVLILRAQ